jgi:hypothetical protein
MSNLLAHEFATIIPAMTAAEYAELKADIAAHGVRVPIVLFEGKILDGRNRERAALETDKTCPSIVFNGSRDEALDHVISLNVSRRHLNESQRAMIAEEIATLRVGGQRGNTNAEKTNGPRDPFVFPDQRNTIARAAKQLSVSPISVKRARAVKRDGTKEQVEAIRAGKKTVFGTLKDIRMVKARKVVEAIKAEPTAKSSTDSLKLIALKHNLPADTFIAHQYQFRVRLSEQARRDLDRAARFERHLNAQMMVVEFIAEKIAPAPESQFVRKNVFEVGTKLTEIGLTREQVDPDFIGSDLEFTRKYGRVLLHTKAEIETEKATVRANELAVALRDFAKAVPSDVTADDVLMWIKEGRKSNARNDDKIIERIRVMRNVIDRLLPVLDEVEKTVPVKASK